MDFTIGADIEVMLEKNGTLVSAIDYLPRSKDSGGKPIELPKGEIFYDNVLAEFTVTPAKTADEFATNILSNLAAAAELAKKHGLSIRMAASAHYPKSCLEHDDAKRFGCSPDYDAYRMKVNKVSAETANTTTLRTAGAHIHFAHPIFQDPRKVPEMIKMMDLFLGVPSILRDNTPQAIERRTLYGKAGAHRPKKYPGGEYRPLSNFWVKDESTVKWAYAQTKKCLELIVAGKTVKSLGFDEGFIRDVINGANINAAHSIVNRLETLDVQ